jgi:hypothetical protein
VGMFGNGFYKHFPSPSSTCQRRQDWWKALILNSPNSPNLLLDQLGVAPSPPGTIQQHNNLIHNLPFHYLEQRGTPTPPPPLLRLFWDHLVFFQPSFRCSDCQRGGFPKGWREWLCKESAKGGKEMISSSVILWHWWCLKFLVLILLKGKEKGKKNEGSNWYKGIGFHSFISNTLFGFMVLLPIDTKALGLIHPSIIFRLHLWFLFIVTS